MDSKLSGLMSILPAGIQCGPWILVGQLSILINQIHFILTNHAFCALWYSHLTTRFDVVFERIRLSSITNGKELFIDHLRQRPHQGLLMSTWISHQPATPNHRNAVVFSFLDQWVVSVDSLQRSKGYNAYLIATKLLEKK
jgi:hypothetical protein